MRTNEQIAQQVLSLLREQGAEGACSVSRTAKTELYYESGKIDMVRTNRNLSLSVKALKNQKKGTSSVNSGDEASVRQAVADALTAAEVAKEDAAEGLSESAAPKQFSVGPAAPDKDAMYRRFREFLDEVARKYPTISFDSAGIEHDFSDDLYVNTNGVHYQTRQGGYGFSPMFMSKQGDRSSSFNYFGVTFREPSSPFLSLGNAAQTLEDTEKQLNTRTLEGKFTGEVIFTPQCFEDLLGSVEGNFLSGGVLIDGTSIWKDKKETQVADGRLTWRSCPRSDEIAWGYFVTGDGYEARNMDIIQGGVLKNFVIGRYAAQKTGLPRSLSDGGCYVVDAGSDCLEDMIGSTGRGLLMNRFSGGAPSSNGDITGVAKNSFLIENGKVTDAVSEVMISGNLARMLADICAVSRERVNSGSSILPWVKIRGIVISGK